jgi:NAD(P)-dependent dehydrogenase (short-subunit alcohol dehydrogenase family)
LTLQETQEYPSPPGVGFKSLLRGKVAIITGASRGIGAAASHIFADAGAMVVLAARDEQKMESVADTIIENGGKATVVPTDVTNPTSVENLVQETLKTYTRLDVAFNSAGDSHIPTPLVDLKTDDFDRIVRTNLRGVFLSMKFEIPAMLKSHGGAIVNMSSTAGLNGVKGLADYSAAKHGIIGLTKSAALDYAHMNIRVNAIAPGPILNDRIRQLKDRSLVEQAVPMRRIGTPEEVAFLAAWLCSDQASFVTGATIPVDGGRLAGNP